MTAMTISLPVMAQNQTSSYKTTGYVTDENNITRMVTQEVSTRLRRIHFPGRSECKTKLYPRYHPRETRDSAFRISDGPLSRL